MKERIVRTFRRVYNRHSFIETDGLKLYVVDRAESEDGEVEIMDKEDDSIKAVCLENENNIPITNKLYSKQCECAILPREADTEEWLLFIETKYATDLARAQKAEADYPNRMVEQIKATVQYFRSKGIIDPEKVVHAIISFPNLVNEFNSWVFPLIHKDGTEESVLDIRLNDKIIIRATNHAKIVNEKTLLLLS